MNGRIIAGKHGRLASARTIVGRHGHWLGLAILIAYWILTPVPGDSDAHNFYGLGLTDPYRNRWADHESFVYSPAMAN